MFQAIHTIKSIDMTLSVIYFADDHVLLNLLTSWGKEIKCEACRAFYRKTFAQGV